MKIYLVVHSINEFMELSSYYEILSAHATKEKAMEKIECIREGVANGFSKYFGKEIPEVSKYLDGDGYTFGWFTNPDNVEMYSHFYIKETELEEGE